MYGSMIRTAAVAALVMAAAMPAALTTTSKRAWGAQAIEDVLWEAFGFWVEALGLDAHLGAHLEGDAVVEAVGRVFSPGEGGVVVLEDGGHRERVDLVVRKVLDDRQASVLLVVIGHFCFC